MKTFAGYDLEETLSTKEEISEPLKVEATQDGLSERVKSLETSLQIVDAAYQIAVDEELSALNRYRHYENRTLPALSKLTKIFRPDIVKRYDQVRRRINNLIEECSNTLSEKIVTSNKFQRAKENIEDELSVLQGDPPYNEIKRRTEEEHLQKIQSMVFAFYDNSLDGGF